MQTLPVIDPLKASGKTREVLERVAQRIGWVPKMIRLLANSPAATEAYLQHYLISRALIVLIALHLAGALFHTFIRRDGLLRRMALGRRFASPGTSVTERQ